MHADSILAPPRARDLAVPRARDFVDALTGIRALAAGWVLVHHLWLNAGAPSLRIPVVGFDLASVPAAGWLGVDIFFALSGFVLTWQVLHQQHAGRGPFARAHFWRDASDFLVRRVLRVYPAYLATLLFLVVVARLHVYGEPAALSDIALHLALFHNVVSQYVSTINGVYWSMPFEWQFYLAFPLLVLPLLRGRAVWLAVAAVAVAGGMKLTSLLLGPGAEIAQFPWRLDTFVAGMVGATIAYRRPPSASWQRALAACGLASLLAGALYTGQYRILWWTQDANPFLRAVWLDITLPALLIGLCGPRVGVARFFATRPVVWLGVISYSIYLWHIPVMDLSRRLIEPHVPRAALFPLLAVAIVGVSAASYYLIERPFHSPPRTASERWRNPRFRAAIVGAWILGIFALAVAIRA
jgi:peptidoglycan/LPS O-acetylase OafA/YrhL